MLASLKMKYNGEGMNTSPQSTPAPMEYKRPMSPATPVEGMAQPDFNNASPAAPAPKGMYSTLSGPKLNDLLHAPTIMMTYVVQILMAN